MTSSAISPIRTQISPVEKKVPVNTGNGVEMNDVPENGYVRSLVAFFAYLLIPFGGAYLIATYL